LLDATLLYHLRWRKKKVESFIIPPTYFRNNYSIVEVVDKKAESSLQIPDKKAESSLQISEDIQDLKSEDETPEIEIPKSEIVNQQSQISNQNVSALSLASIKAKRELEQQNKSLVKETVHLPQEAFTETDMQLFWNKYAQRLGDKGYKIMESLLLLNDPKLEGTTIVHELPNEGSKIDFESEKNELLGYLRGHLHNHDISIEVRVNEAVENKFAFTPQDKYNRLNEINPSLELLRKTFDLDI
jgi:DNA polymerase III subunit gamma/tau